MEYGKKENRSVKKERSFTQGGEGRGQEGQQPNMKKERSFVKQQQGQQQQQQNHHQQGQQQQQQQYYNNNNRNARDPQQSRRRGAMPATNRSHKPAMELYKPPTLRSPGSYENGGEPMVNGNRGPAVNGQYDNRSYQQQQQAAYTQAQLNVNAKEFVMMNRPPLQHSKSSSTVPNTGRSSSLQHSKSGHNLRQQAANCETSRTPDLPPRGVHFSDDKENDPALKSSLTPQRPPSLAVGAMSGPPAGGVKRSKSLGSADMRACQLEANTPTTIPDLGPFSNDVQTSITKAATDPNGMSGRQVMEVVRHIFTRLVEASRHAEPAARLCIAIIEKEKSETFLESLLNSCQEYFQERDRLLRNNPPATYAGFVPAHPRWIAYMTFLNEMYTQLKRRHVQLMTKRTRNSETPPGLLLLGLLAQCCQVCLKENSVNSLAETECLFFVLTGIGKDIEVELPHQMARVMTGARDAFLNTVRVPAVRKTLLQLIEMHAARWQLPASSVMYYYPGSGAK